MLKLLRSPAMAMRMKRRRRRFERSPSNALCAAGLVCEAYCLRASTLSARGRWHAVQSNGRRGSGASKPHGEGTSVTHRSGLMTERARTNHSRSPCGAINLGFMKHCDDSAAQQRQKTRATCVWVALSKKKMPRLLLPC